jgi:hypothetical protein
MCDFRELCGLSFVTNPSNQHDDDGTDYIIYTGNQITEGRVDVKCLGLHRKIFLANLCFFTVGSIQTFKIRLGRIRVNTEALKLTLSFTAKVVAI